MRKLRVLLLLAAGYAGSIASTPIARWDVVPKQVFSQTFKAGVIAFHEAGCTVEFTINGTRQRTVAAPTWNDRVSVVEYWTELDPADYSDGPVTIGATVIPGGSGHTPRTLKTLILFANHGGSLTNTTVKWVDARSGNDTSGDGTEAKPYQTIRKGFQNVGAGGTVYVKAGSYYLRDGSGGWPTYQYWTTIRPAPGVTREQVVVKAYRTDNGFMRYQGFSMRTHAEWGSVFYGGMDYDSLWADSLDISDERGKTEGTTTHYATVTYITNCYFHQFSNGPGCHFVRNVLIEDILSDGVSGADLAVNITIDGIDPGTSGAHPDVYQLYSAGDTLRNKIVYNLKAYDALSQGLFNGGTSIQDIAFVNILIHKVNTVMYTQFSGYMNHVLFWHVGLDQQTFLWREGTAARDLYVENCLLHNMGQSPGVSVNGITFSHNHFVSGSTYGTDFTTGDPLYNDPGGRDYHLQDGSPAKGSGKVLDCVPADMDGRLYDPAAPSKGPYSSYVEHIRAVTPGAGTVGSFMVFPNPVRSTEPVRILSGPGMAGRTAFLAFDVYGDIKYQGSWDGGPEHTWIPADRYGAFLPNGIYVLAVRNNGQIQYVKCVIER